MAYRWVQRWLKFAEFWAAEVVYAAVRQRVGHYDDDTSDDDDDVYQYGETLHHSHAAAAEAGWLQTLSRHATNTAVQQENIVALYVTTYHSVAHSLVYNIVCKSNNQSQWETPDFG